MQTTGSAHTRSIYHDRIHTYNSRDFQFLCKETYEFHHDHWSDCDTYVIFISFFHQFFYHCCYHSGMTVRTVIRTWIIISGYCFHLFFQDQHIFCLRTDDNISINTVFMEPFHLWIYRCCSDTASDKQDLFLLQFFDIFLYEF